MPCETKKKIIAVMGTSTPDVELFEMAKEVGLLLAKKGAVIVCGGKGGVMEAVCLGASAAGGISVGILPGAHDEPNAYVTIPIRTTLGEARNAIIASACEVAIAIGGGFGTLSEIGLALRMGKTVVGLRTWEAFDHEGAPLPVFRAESPSEAVERALSLCSGVKS